MTHTRILLSTLMASMVLAGCTATQSQQTSQETTVIAPTAPIVAENTFVATESNTLTLKKAMAHPDWLARSPMGAYWGVDSNTFYYRQKRLGSELQNVFMSAINTPNSATEVGLDALHLIGGDNQVFNQDKSKVLYQFKGDIFLKTVATGEVTQLTKTSDYETAPQFLNNGDMVYRHGNRLMRIDHTTFLVDELVNLALSDAQSAQSSSSDYIAKEQEKLIQYVALTKRNQNEQDAFEKAINNSNPSRANNTFYLGEGNRIVAVSLSPKGDKLIVVTTPSRSWRDESDIMPNYIGQDGRIKAEKVRRRVADAKPQESTVHMIDLDMGLIDSLAYNTLPGFDEDVLKQEKSENYARDGKVYDSKPSPRAINLMQDWGWSQSAIQWHEGGDDVAIMLEAWDNKDRWIATVDFEKRELVPQHRLHDDAWVNYTFNDFGWLENQKSLYFLSEQSGYSQLYLKPLNGKATQLTKGRYEVQNVTRLDDDAGFVFKANVTHPGIYNIYQVGNQGGEPVPLTELTGMTDYSLSPDESKLLLTHSTLTAPPELFVIDRAQNAEPLKLTDTSTEAFKNTPLIAPDVIAVPSSHGEQPIFAKVYYPRDFKKDETTKRKAVIFNHGAGYLQNSHLGWSGYFREFMFHSLLAEQGYIVMDMDYRASKGYGRDWRTAIYRQMGTPEVQDLQDGVTWLVENANVDVNRVGTYGGSYGGFMTFMALFKEPGLFKAGAALRPVTDWAHYNAPYTSNILNHPDVDPIAYERSSPIYFAEGLQDKLLINAPMVDDNVFFVDVVRLVQRLIELEKEDFETAIYPVEPHGFRQPSSWLDEYRRIYKLFEETL